MSKLLLVVPNYSDEEVNNYSKKNLTVPYGVLSLASYVEYYCPDVKCEILDLNAFENSKAQNNALTNKILEFRPKFVGISAMFNSYFDQIAPLCEVIKKDSPNIIILVGGVLATNLAKEIFDTTDLIDAICHGEGEIPLRDLFLTDDIEKTFKLHPSWLTKKDLHEGKKVSASLVQNLDDIPILQYSKLDLNMYTGRINDGTNTKSLPIHSTRGCPYNCIFCSAGTNHGKKIRQMSPERFLSDVKEMIEKYDIKELSIDDDQFLFYKDRAIKILKGLAEFNISIEMASGISIKFIDDEIANLLKEAGLKTAVIAVESGSQRVLEDIIKKPLNISQIEPVVKSLRKAGLFVHAPFIIGLPGETQEDRDLSRKLILEIGFDWNFIFIAMPLKGSRLYDICIENNYISPSDLKNLSAYKCIIKAPNINPEEITEQAYLLNLDVNFVNNYNYINNKYDIALEYFLKIATKYPNHAFAHYYTSKCYKNLGNEKKSYFYLKEFETIIKADENWKNRAIRFNLV